MHDQPIQVAVLDMAGTTVADDGLVIAAFDAAATAVGVPETGAEREYARRYVLDTMGQSKIVVFRALFHSEERAQQANGAFEKSYADLVDNGAAQPIGGAAEAISRLRDNGIRVALTTGFSAGTQNKLLSALGWHTLADVALAAGDGVRGRPYPDLNLTAMMRLGADGVRNLAVLGDTVSDIESGLRSGAAVVAGTLTGAHSGQQLRDAGASHIVASVTEFAELVLSHR